MSSSPPAPVSGATATDLGTRVRHARLARKLTLKAFAEQVGCSESQVSKVERGLVAPSLAMLHRMAAVIDTNVSDLLGHERYETGPILRHGKRLVSSFDAGASGIQLERIDTARRGSLLQAHIHIVPPGSKSDGAIDHIGEEVGYVIEGSVLLNLGSERYLLEIGDAFHFGSQIPHSYENTGTEVARILWVNTPATF